MANHKDMISSEEARIMLLEQKNDDFHQTLMRIESKIDSLDKKFDAKIDALDKKFDAKIDSQNSKIDSHFRWTVALIFGLYATGFATLIGAVEKAYSWF